MLLCKTSMLAILKEQLCKFVAQSQKSRSLWWSGFLLIPYFYLFTLALNKIGNGIFWEAISNRLEVISAVFGFADDVKEGQYFAAFAL